MSTRTFKTVALVMLAAIAYASAGPQVCRAVMAGGGNAGTPAVKCCGDGNVPPAHENTPADPHQSCPLHKLSQIELLPASVTESAPAAPVLMFGAAPIAAVLTSLSPPVFRTIIGTSAGPPGRLGVPIHILHQTLRR